MVIYKIILYNINLTYGLANLNIHREIPVIVEEVKIIVLSQRHISTFWCNVMLQHNCSVYSVTVTFVVLRGSLELSGFFDNHL